MKKILIIDDEPDITEIVNLFSLKLGYQTDVSHSGDGILDKLSMNDYWAVFCDLKMPGLNGLEIFDKITETSAALSQRFVLLTGAILDPNTEAKVTKKNILFFRKPFNFEDFKKLVLALEHRHNGQGPLQ